MEHIWFAVIMRWERKRGVIEMEANKEKLESLLKEIEALIRDNENADGSFKFDLVKAVVALDFAKTEIEKMISK